MAKDDFDVIVFKILTYYYACLKRKISFDKSVLMKILDHVQEEYLTDIMRMMQEDGLISGVTVIKAWCNDYIITSELEDIRITLSGIRYLKDNSKMKELFEAVKASVGLLSNLVKITLL